MKPDKISLNLDRTKIPAHFSPNEKKMLFIFFVNYFWKIKYTCRSQLIRLFHSQITLQIHFVGENCTIFFNILKIGQFVCYCHPIEGELTAGRCQKSFMLIHVSSHTYTILNTYAASSFHIHVRTFQMTIAIIETNVKTHY